MAVSDPITSARTTAFMRRVNALENDWAYDWDTRTFTGTTTATTANKLVDSTGQFTKYITEGDTVRNDTDATSATITGVDSDTQLSLDSNIFTSGEDYTITAKRVYHGLFPLSQHAAGGEYAYSVAFNSSEFGDYEIIRLSADLLTATKIIDNGTGEGDVDGQSAKLSYNPGTGNLFIADTPTTTRQNESTTTSTSSGKLIDSTASFLTTVRVGDTVNNITDTTSATVSAIDSNTQITLSTDIFTSGEQYTISTKQVRVQRFQEDGTLDWESFIPLEKDGSGNQLLNDISGVAALSDGSCLLVTRNGGTYSWSHLKSVSDDGATVTNIFGIQASTAASGDVNGVYSCIPWTDDYGAVTFTCNNDYAECRIYDSSGTLIETIPRPTTHSANYSDSFNWPQLITQSGFVLSSDVITDAFPATFAGDEMVHFNDGAYIGPSDYNTFDPSDTGFPGGGSQTGIVTLIGQIGGKLYGIPGPSIDYYAMAAISTDYPQTEWYRYPTPGSGTGSVSLGTPDYGESVPATDALTGYVPHYFELRDLRDAIEAVCVNYKNSATGNAYNLTVSSADNIFHVAIQNGQYDWTTASVTHGDMIRDEHWNDIDLVLTQLEASELA